MPSVAKKLSPKDSVSESLTMANLLDVSFFQVWGSIAVGCVSSGCESHGFGAVGRFRGGGEIVDSLPMVTLANEAWGDLHALGAMLRQNVVNALCNSLTLQASCGISIFHGSQAVV
jgi:hypothetical protein